jgi:hypothetical protein
LPLDQMTYNTRASGDGTVAYWCLKWPITWRKSGIEVEQVEVPGADHRNILDKPECSMAVLSECCSHPTRYLEVILDDLVIKSDTTTVGCLAALTCISTMGVVNQGNVFLCLSWRGVNFATESKSEASCAPDTATKLFKSRRFVFGVTKQDLDEDRAIEISVRTPAVTKLETGTLREGTKLMKLPVSTLLDSATDTSVVTFDDSGEIMLKWSCRSISADRYGMPEL